MKASLKSLVARDPQQSAAPQQAAPSPKPDGVGPEPHYRTAQTRADTRQIGGHFKAEAQQTLKLIAAEEDKDVQELIAEALNMLFSRYGKPTRIEVISGRRDRTGRRTVTNQAR